MKLIIDHIGVMLDGKKIIDEINMTVDSGRFVGIIGPNGSGKSTLLKSIYRVYKPHIGIMYLNGKELFKMPIKESACSIGVVSQFNNLNFDFKVDEMVLMGRNPHKKIFQQNTEADYRILHDALEKVGMKDFADRSFLTLSGGEQQRVLLARALAQNVKLLILDEPTNHLDIKYQLQIMDLVKSLGITVLAALHDLNLAAAYCDKIYVMKKGSVFAGGSPHNVITQEIIKQVFEVDSMIYFDENKTKMHIAFHT